MLLSYGSNVFVPPLIVGLAWQRDYVIQVRESVFVEGDSSKACRVYPTPDHSSYRACDNHFMSTFVATFEPPSLRPIWLSENPENVTNRVHMTSLGKLKTAHYVLEVLSREQLILLSQL